MVADGTNLFCYPVSSDAGLSTGKIIGVGERNRVCARADGYGSVCIGFPIDAGVDGTGFDCFSGVTFLSL